jgi:hypothetical protein
MGNRKGTDDDDHRLGMQLDAITQTLAAAEATHDLEQREQLLETAARALEVTRREQHKEAERKKARPLLRIVHSGAGVIAAATTAEWARETWDAQQGLTIDATAAATATSVTLATVIMGV